MYRAVALYQIENGLDIHSAESLESSLEKIKIDIFNVGGIQKIYLNSRNVSDLIRTQEISEGASVVAANARVREKLVAEQRQLASAGRVVMDGRDIGSHVLPWAQVKIYLDASIETRAMRRAKELEAKGLPSDFKKICEETSIRDERDKNRKLNPLVRTPDAFYIDTGKLTTEETVDAIVNIVSKTRENQ
jgi:cytidylate kinase